MSEIKNLASVFAGNGGNGGTTAKAIPILPPVAE